VLADNLLEGTLDLGALPPNLSYFRVNNNHHSGTVDVAALDTPSLRVFRLDDNELEGEFEFASLPAYTETVTLANNRFHGRLTWDDFNNNLFRCGTGRPSPVAQQDALAQVAAPRPVQQQLYGPQLRLGRPAFG